MLRAIADEVAFLDLSAPEFSNAFPPDLAKQKEIMDRVIQYLVAVNPQLPNFIATRVTSHYEEVLRKRSGSDGTRMQDGPLSFKYQTQDTVFFRDGHDVVDRGRSQASGTNPHESQLVVYRIFGPILDSLVKDASAGELSWNHWEQSVKGQLAVFRFNVPAASSHYSVDFDSSCFFNDERPNMSMKSAYHGTITVDPANGPILRLVMQATSSPESRMLRADMLVEYGATEIGKKTYLCPTRSIAISRWRTDINFNALHLDLLAPPVTTMNDSIYTNYHRFGSEAKILTSP